MSRAILDFPAPPGAPGRLRFTAPHRIITAAAVSGVRRALREVETEAAAGHWLVGWIAYEAAPAFDPALASRAPRAGLPLLWFAAFGPPEPGTAPAPGTAAAPSLQWAAGTERAAYDSAIAAIREAIAAGDVYQVNHTLRFRAPWDADADVVYDALVASRQGLYHAFIETTDWAIVSASPELFLDIRDGTVTTRPMKGTLRRGRWLEEDAAAAARLAASAKDRAENLMIVDLLRNDLGRVAEFGTVAVPRLFEVETYPTVHQLTSTVTARLREGTRLDDVLAATFPCGSVTGAPKFTAMRAIAELEDEPRGVYCGAVGVVRPDGSATFNVAIRTLLVDRRAATATYGAGGGVTWDSRADAEYAEALAKAALLTEGLPAFDLVETLRLDDGEWSRLERHLRRLDESARYWGFAADTAGNAAAALDAVRRAVPVGSWRVRLTASADGAVRVTRTPLESAAHARVPLPAEVALCARPVSSSDRLLFHKTTARAVYDAARAAHPDAFDVLLHNEDGLITEFTTGNVVAALGGELLTPPRECGLLAGTFRGELLDAGIIREATMTPADLRRAAGLWYINSVRGWVPVVLRRGPHEGGTGAGSR